MNHFLISLILFTQGTAFASTALDKEYGYRNIAAVVTNVEREPVYGEQVENEIVGFLRNSNRFEFSDQGYLLLREKIRPFRQPMSEMAPNTMLEPLKPTLDKLDKIGVTSVILGEVVKDNVGDYLVVLQLATTKNAEPAFSASVKVENGSSLEAFGNATREALGQIVKWIPFDATIIKRDGTLVVLDRGRPAFQKGQQLLTYTVEKKTDGVLFEESGVIGLTQVDENLAFGKILVERRPLEVTIGNKIRLDNKPAFRVSPSLWSIGGRDLASDGPSFEVNKGKFGVLSAGLGPSIVSFETKNTAGTASESMNSTYPTGNFNAEVWLTSRVTLSLGMKYGLGGKKSVGGLTAEKVDTTVSGLNLLGGYRIALFAPDPGPIVHFKLGYSRQSFGFDSEKELIYTSMTYSGIMLGGGITFPVTQSIDLGFDVESLIFPSVTESPFKSGTDAKNISAWDFAMKGMYRWDKNTDLEAKVFLQRNGADFSGKSQRVLDYTSVSQVTRGFLLGVSYYF